MSMNFCSAAYFTNVSCSCVCSDGFEATNLVTGDSKGFQGERFVRTPVAIQFDFYVPICVHRIDLTPAIGRQCAKFMQVFVSSTQKCTKKEESSPTTVSLEPDASFRKAGEVNLTTPNKISLVNRGYRPHPRLKLPHKLTDASVVYLNGNLSRVTSIKVIIRRMLTGSIPSILQAEIWGRPSRNCPAARTREIYRIRDERYQRSEIEAPPVEPHVAETEQAEPNLVDSKDHKTSAAIPTEFIDPLTCETMRIPVRLPSGHTVDRGTLDKHIQSQAAMGNVPSDPFTGVPFTDALKPVPNMLLKARMDDHFLKQSQNEAGREVTMKRKLFSSGPASKAIRLDLNLNLPSASHAEDLHSSLDAGLCNAVTNVKTRTLKLDADPPNSLSLFCHGCNTFLFSTSLRYGLPCKHTLCHKCVLSHRAGPAACPTCSLVCKPSEIQRIY